MSTDHAEFTIAMRVDELPTANKTRREHYQVQAKKRKALREKAATAAEGIGTVNWPVRITVEIGWPDKRRRDLDGPDLKGLIDGIVDAKVIPDDGPMYVTEHVRRLSEHRPMKGIVRLTVRVEEVGRG